MLRRRGIAGLLALVAAIAAIAAIPAGAGAKTVRHIGWVTAKDVPDEGGCQRTTFFYWAALPGAKSYYLDMHDTLGYSFTATYPPYNAESEGEFGGNPPVARGQHRHALTYQAHGGTCEGFADDAARYTIRKFTATFDDRSRIIGTVTQRDGTPVRGIRISISGPRGSGSETTNRGGAYARLVKEGRYTVKAPFGYCVRGGGRECKRSTSVSVTNTEAVHFVAGGEVMLSGQVFRRECADENCEDLDQVPLQNQTITATATDGSDQASALTNGRGKFEIGVRIGEQYKVKYPISPNAVPKFYLVTARGDVDNLNFELCDPPPGYEGENIGCRIVRVNGEVVDRDGRPYANALVSGPGDRAKTNKQGHFSLFVPRGRVRLRAEGELIAESSETVRANERVNTTRMKLFTRLRISQSDRELIHFLTDALPTRHGEGRFELAIERDRAVADRSCRFRQKVFFNPVHGRYASFNFGPNQGFSEFCPGKYAANVYDPDGRELQTDVFTIP